ncbi:MAG: hypothetical protein EZS28_011748 [Streblomastix strix]|uniref:Uncharacterized protein n=1 Tax=Streblomastix strix TaxID=222440 RepID=A0A5J4WD03_9EUKA|nr:MAG: hypothetical protein EZS28_011748 [Streblomastix strix]
MIQAEEFLEDYQNLRVQKSKKSEYLSRCVGQEIVRAGMDKIQSLTSIRAAAITKAFKLGVITEVVNLSNQNSNAAFTIQKYYDKNRNYDTREMIKT